MDIVIFITVGAMLLFGLIECIKYVSDLESHNRALLSENDSLKRSLRSSQAELHEARENARNVLNTYGLKCYNGPDCKLRGSLRSGASFVI